MRIRLFYWVFLCGYNMWRKLGFQFSCLWCRPSVGYPLYQSQKRKTMKFNVGDKVICDRAKWKTEQELSAKAPDVGEMLTVLETHDFENLQLLWFSNDIDAAAFPAHCFRLFYDHNVERIMREVGAYPKKIR